MTGYGAGRSATVSTMSLTQESVLFWLINEGGKVKKSEIVNHFKGPLNCLDPEEKQRNRELFKTFVNSVASVREIDGVRYVVLKKMYQHLLKGAESAEEKPEDGELQPAGEQLSPPGRREAAGSGDDAAGSGTAVPEADEESGGEDRDSPTEMLSLVQVALRRNRFSGARRTKTLKFEIQQRPTCGDEQRAANHSKPYALPLRIPASAPRVEVRKLDPGPPEGSPQGSPQIKKRLPPMERGCSSPQLRRVAKSTGAPEEPTPTVPLEDLEHQWLVKCAAGHWEQVHGLLLRDSHLAEKRDFMSGFTALHWAAKCGNGGMLVTIVDLAKKGGVQLDINAKTHGGYTPLHIAALHKQEYVVAMLMAEYGADPNIRDNCGKRPHHYLQGDASRSVREMLSRPTAPAPARPAPENVQWDRDEPDLSRGRPSISRLFQHHAASHKKKKLKQSLGFPSLSEEPEEERGDGM